MDFEINSYFLSAVRPSEHNLKLITHLSVVFGKYKGLFLTKRKFLTNFNYNYIHKISMKNYARAHKKV